MKKNLTWKDALKTGLIAGFISSAGMMLFWNLIGLTVLEFFSLSYIEGLIIGHPNFSVEKLAIYNAQNFSAAFILSFLFYEGLKSIDESSFKGILFYTLFACFGFLYFVGWSSFLAEDFHDLLLLFMLDDLFQTLFIMVPIVLLSKRKIFLEK